MEQPLPILPIDPISDAHEISSLVSSAFWVREPMKTIFGQNNYDEYQEYTISLTAPRLVGPGKETLKICDPETGKIISFFTIQHPHAKTPEEILAAKNINSAPHISGTNIPLFDATFGMMAKMRLKYGFDPEVDYSGTMIGTHPSYQGRGLARQLVLEGLKYADKANKKWWAACWPASASVYRKLGFEVLAVEELDMSLYEGGGEGKIPFYLLVRDPKPVVEEKGGEKIGEKGGVGMEERDVEKGLGFSGGEKVRELNKEEREMKVDIKRGEVEEIEKEPGWVTKVVRSYWL